MQSNREREEIRTGTNTRLYSTTLRKASYLVKGKGKARPRTGHEGTEWEHRYTSTFSLTSVLDDGMWLTSRPDHFTPRKETWYPLYRRLGGPQGRSE